jgi:hypothetical protein
MRDDPRPKGVERLTRDGRACPGHPRLACGKAREEEDVDARHKAGHDDSISNAEVIKPATIAILRSGVLAREFCRRGAPAVIEAVFERSLYLRAGEAFICIGEAEVGNGPLTLIADCGVSPRLRDLGLRPGRTAAISRRQITLGDAAVFTLERCSLWRRPAWPTGPTSSKLADLSDALYRRAANDAPDEGLARVVFGPQEGRPSSTPLGRVARVRIANFEAWLSRAREHGEFAPNAPLEGLVGLGPGLTPSGDDFLLGALALLDALAERKACAALAAAVAALSPALTSPLSLCFLRAGAIGHVGEHLHGIVCAVLSGNVQAGIATATRIGHSSGWDMLAGAASALRVLASPQPSAEITASVLVTTDTF